MKTTILIAVITLFAPNLFVMTIDTEAKYDTVYKQPTKVQKTFGKLPSSGAYGIFLKVSCRAQKGESDHEALFFRLKSEVVQEGKFLYAIIAGKKIMLAEKKMVWMGIS